MACDCVTVAGGWIGTSSTSGLNTGVIPESDCLFRRFLRTGGISSLSSWSSPSYLYLARRIVPDFRLDKTALNLNAKGTPTDVSRSETCLKNSTSDSNHIDRGSLKANPAGRYSKSIKLEGLATIFSNGACLLSSRHASSGTTISMDTHAER